MLYSGFWKRRPDDQIGLAFTYYQVSPSLTRTESLEQEFGLPPTCQYTTRARSAARCHGIFRDGEGS